MAPSRDSNVKRGDTGENSQISYKKAINAKSERVLQNRKHANDIFDVIEYLQSDKEKEIICASNACGKIFCELFERGELYVGQLPSEDEIVQGDRSAKEKYHIFMRHRYNNCVELLLENIGHNVFQVKESSLCAVMKFVSAEGKHPLQNLDWSEHYSFPRELILALVEHLLSEKEDMSLLISRFQEFLEMDDVRYYFMSSVRDNITRVMERNKGAVISVYQNNVFTLLSSINIPSQASEMTNFLVKQESKHEDWKAARLKEHKRAYEQMWLVFLKYKLPGSMYKKILVILHESIMPQMSDPTLMIDFLTAAYDIGGAISLLALNGLFVLIHKHNLDYPDFYKKLYNLLEPTIFHVKYRARFFHLANIFLSSTHLPVYLVAAFVKRLARLALTAPPTALLIVLPFICNLIRRHPSCRVVIHRPSAAEEPCDDPYVMEEEDPAKCHALESSLWEIQTLQKHYHPDVAKAAKLINDPLSESEDDISKLLELSTFELMQRELKAERKTIPLEFDTATELLKSSKEVLGVHFSLE
ncbi:nucleolar complex protein 4 homolog [Triplophysa rosa]|uniref:Nucleolar complex protein 4-like protein n=1 Tax=Triplophysa rosa TaxID=992332 RepID=A0A9W7WFI7_TRIRA|nr:nucleolar complex protein 4 homolog [Triplophysa rosa]KAI7795828.1 nucleolar complex protein 4-like protein [Triplophysa rosa]